MGMHMEQHRCWACGDFVTEKAHCKRCDSYVCTRCGVYAPLGQHTAQDHLAETKSGAKTPTVPVLERIERAARQGNAIRLNRDEVWLLARIVPEISERTYAVRLLHLCPACRVEGTRHTPPGMRHGGVCSRCGGLGRIAHPTAEDEASK